MQFDKNRKTANPGERSICPICDSPVIAKCGKILVWHWAHENLEDCDSFSEGETLWHLNMKNLYPKDWQEVVIIKNDKKHRADVLKPDGTVIEFQHSPITTEEVVKRNEFYGNVIWCFDRNDKQQSFTKKQGFYTVKINRCPEVFKMLGDFFIQFKSYFFHVKKLYSNGRGWGNFHKGQI